MSWSSSTTGWDTKKKLGRGKWQLGNPKRRSELVQHFETTSGMHGLAYLCSTGRNASICVSIIYRVFFSACFLFMTYSVVVLLRDNLGKQSVSVAAINRNTQTGLEEDPDHFPFFPRVTICRMPSYKTDFNTSYLALVQYVMLSLGEPFQALTVTEQKSLLEIAFYEGMSSLMTETTIELKDRLAELEERFKDLKKMDNFDLREFIYDHSPNCSEFFSECHTSVFVPDCCDLFEPVLTSLGLCFALLDMQWQSLSLPASGLGLLIDLKTPSALAQRSEFGFKIFLSDPLLDAPFVFGDFDGEKLLPGLSVVIKTKLVKTQRVSLHTPWHGLWSTCPKRRYNETYESDRYSHETCLHDHAPRELKARCNCQPLIYPTGSSNLKFCEPLDWYQCRYSTVGISKLFEEDSENSFTSECEEPCIVYSYKTDLSSAGLGGNENISRVEIVYNNKEYTYNEYKKTTITSLLSQIGGSLGLYLGASIITVMEILIFAIRWTWLKLAPSQQVKTSAKVHANLEERRQSTCFDRRQKYNGTHDYSTRNRK